MKLIRYRHPSLKTLLGITQAKRQFRKATGLSTIDRYTNPSRIKGHYKQKVDFYSPLVRTIRQTSKGNLPSWLGFFKKK